MLSRRLLLLLGLPLLVLLAFFTVRGQAGMQLVSETGEAGLRPVECWFDVSDNWPVTECYYMQVPESHGQPDSRVISFPVIVFRSDSLLSSEAPLLHLGAGGPGAAMYLDSAESVQVIWEYHDEMSVRQGRDLYVMDPRGTGLAQPLLTCDTFVDNVTVRLGENLTLEEEWARADQDYYDCIDRFLAEGVDLSSYNSLSIANDVELLRRAAGVDRWVLLGVSYGATYAQIIANEFPDTVEAMILDSATFPGLKPDHNFVERTLAPYEAIYHYCDIDEGCLKPLEDFKSRFWWVYHRLQKNPIIVSLDNPSGDGSIRVVINGERFLAAILEGTYGESIFREVPQIVIELEQGDTTTLEPYLVDHVAFLLDRSFGDVSSNTHFCFETKPFTDFDGMKRRAKALPPGYIRESALRSLDWPDYCQRMQVLGGDARVAETVTTDIPALFLHGRLDTITPLDAVLHLKEHFRQSELVVFERSHDVLGSEACAELVAAEFIEHRQVDPHFTACRSSL